MKKNKKGFTLVELLAVIVVLGIIMSIAGTAVLKQKKKANQGEVDSLYNTIKSLGPDVYLSEKKVGCYYTSDWLKEKGYLKSEVKNPANSKENCEAYLIVNKDENNMFDAYIECSGLEPKGTKLENTNMCE